MGDLVRHPTNGRPSLERQADYEVKAQAAAEEHLAKCQEALYDEGDGEPAESPAFAPYCGCDTCVIREVLMSAWPHVLEAAKEEVRREAG